MTQIKGSLGSLQFHQIVEAEIALPSIIMSDTTGNNLAGSFYRYVGYRAAPSLVTTITFVSSGIGTGTFNTVGFHALANSYVGGVHVLTMSNAYSDNENFYATVLFPPKIKILNASVNTVSVVYDRMLMATWELELKRK